MGKLSFEALTPYLMVTKTRNLRGKRGETLSNQHPCRLMFLLKLPLKLSRCPGDAMGVGHLNSGPVNLLYAGKGSTSPRLHTQPPFSWRHAVSEQPRSPLSPPDSVGGCFVADLGTSHHLEEVGPFDQLKMQLNVINLLGTKYWATIGTTVFIASDPTSISNNTLRPWAPRSVTRTFSMRF